jgi:hypothetical protein
MKKYLERLREREEWRLGFHVDRLCEPSQRATSLLIHCVKYILD